MLDFDGTMTTVDVGDAVCNHFAPPDWRLVDERWMRREISLPEAQTQMWALARGTRQQMEDFARGIAIPPRAGLAALVRHARDCGARVVVASGGFDFCIAPVYARLEHELGSGCIDALYCNGARFAGDRMSPVFNTDGVACAVCAVCKGQVCDRERAAGAGRVVFVGDGASDGCAIGRADAIAAVRGGVLHARCVEAGVAHLAFDDLAEVIALV